MAGVKKEIWTNAVLQNFVHKGKFLETVPGYDQLVDNDVIHMVEIGIDPNVLINNSGAIGIVSMPDNDIAIPLDKFETENSRITDDELHAIAYPKIQAVVEKHVRALESKTLEYAAHNLSPIVATANTPFLETTGALSGGLKKVTRQDVIALKEALDTMGIPDEDRVLVLSKQHYNQLLENDDMFQRQHLAVNQSDGAQEYYGFMIYSYGKNPRYTKTGPNAFVKLPLGAVPATTDRQVSFAFHKSQTMKARGTTKEYMLEASQNPTIRENVLGFSQRFVAGAVRQYALAVLFPGT